MSEIGNAEEVYIMRSNRRIFVNIDINSVTTPFLNRVAENENVRKEDLYPFVDIYSGHGVTDLLFNVFCQFSTTDSKVFTDYRGKFEQKVENGVEVNYHDQFVGVYRLNVKHGIDPFRVWIERCAEKGIKSWLSVRMNDCHCPDETACFLRSDFFYEAREKGWCVGNKYGYYRYCFDYSYDEVRRKMLDYIDEQLGMYDVDGLELDFQREIICFDYLSGKDYTVIMTNFIREVKKIVTRHEASRGHKIEICLRLCRSVEDNLGFGFDVQAYYDEKLVDSVSPVARWSTHDSDMPIKEWLERFPDIEIYAGIEALINDKIGVPASSPAKRGFVTSYVSDEPDGIYYYNYYLNPHNGEESCAPSLNFFEEGASPIEETIKKPLSFVVTYQDTCPIFDTPWRPFPKMIAKGEIYDVPVKTGRLPDRAATLIFGIVGDRIDDVELTFNGKKVSGFVKLEGCDRALMSDNFKLGVVLYEAPVSLDLDSFYQELEIKCLKGSVIMRYAEVTVL